MKEVTLCSTEVLDTCRTAIERFRERNLTRCLGIKSGRLSGVEERVVEDSGLLPREVHKEIRTRLMAKRQEDKSDK